MLDLLLTSEDNMISNVEHHAGFSLSDHIIITCNLQVSSQNQKKAELRFRYHTGDYKKMNQNLLEMDWENDVNALKAEDAWTFFSSMLNDQMRKYIPKSAPREKNLGDQGSHSKA
ncbi:hypothetical protein LSH36_63g05000 [Paralvinella palmiformis]|uniref:Uncharacterized protein n=1 Tax=Paralvinella palmiformis TaxID=53620 RepID=A0AAD9K5L6_9ANNE|nr:hypothetical protein LSH36_63g05000 [Paralvinella palmiformis]